MGTTNLGVFSGLRGDKGAQGVCVDLRDDLVDIDAHIVVEYGTNIPEVGEACRVAVHQQVEVATGMTVRAVNIVVTDIHFPEQAADDPG